MGIMEVQIRLIFQRGQHLPKVCFSFLFKLSTILFVNVNIIISSI